MAGFAPAIVTTGKILFFLLRAALLVFSDLSVLLTPPFTGGAFGPLPRTDRLMIVSYLKPEINW